MELDELKSGWQNAGGGLKTEKDLQRMTKLFNHPSIKKIKRKLIIEIALFLLFLFVYYDWFDGDKKPLYANLALVAGLLLYLLNSVIGYVSITKPVGTAGLKQSIEQYLRSIKRLSVFSILITILYSVSIIVFFASTIQFTKEKGLILAFSSVIVFQLIILSSKLWASWIKNLKQQVNDFNLEEI